jgi:hypothetical protein
MKSKRMRWTAHLVSTGETKNIHKRLFGKRGSETPLEELGVYGTIILQWILGKEDGNMWSAFIRLSTGTRDGLLSTRK